MPTPAGTFISEGTGPLGTSILRHCLHALGDALKNPGPAPSAEAQPRSPALVVSALESLEFGKVAGADPSPAYLDEVLAPLEALAVMLGGPKSDVRLDLASRAGVVHVNELSLRRAVLVWLHLVLDADPGASIRVSVQLDQAQEGAGLPRVVLSLSKAGATGGPRNGEARLWELELRDLFRTWRAGVTFKSLPVSGWDVDISFPVFTIPGSGVTSASHAGALWRLALVEEDAAEREALAGKLRAAGLLVFTFDDEAEALEAVRHDARPFHVAIAGVGDFGAAGLSFTKLMREESPCTHLLYSATAEQAARSRATGECRILSKPFDADEVLRTVDALYKKARPRVLIADDDPGARALARECLAREDLEITEAEDGLAACELLQKRDYDLLIIDLVMPVHDGLRTIRSICRRNHRLRILAVSGVRPEYLRAAELLGANAALAKPFAPEKLRAAVLSLLGPASHVRHA